MCSATDGAQSQLAWKIVEYEAWMRERIVGLNIDEVCGLIENAYLAGSDVRIPVQVSVPPSPTCWAIGDPFGIRKILVSKEEVAVYVGLCEQVRRLKSGLIEMIKNVRVDG